MLEPPKEMTKPAFGILSALVPTSTREHHEIERRREGSEQIRPSPDGSYEKMPAPAHRCRVAGIQSRPIQGPASSFYFQGIDNPATMRSG